MFHFSDKIHNAAFDESMKTTDTKQNLAAVIETQKNGIIVGRNFRSFGSTHTCCCHAEMDAIYRHLKISRKWETFHKILKRTYKVTEGALSRIPGRAANQRIQKSIDNIVSQNIKSRSPRLKRIKREKCKLYVFRFISDGKLANAKPCAECSRWIRLASTVGIDYDIYYTDDNQELKPYQYDCNHYLPADTYF